MTTILNLSDAWLQCGENGHFANRCPKGALSFLSNKGPQAAAAAAAHHAERNSGGGGGGEAACLTDSHLLRALLVANSH